MKRKRPPTKDLPSIIKSPKKPVLHFLLKQKGVTVKPEHLKIHETCINLCQRYMRMEAPIIAQLQLVGEFEIYKELGLKNLYTYGVKLCGLPEGAAYSFIAVGKMAKLYP